MNFDISGLIGKKVIYSENIKGEVVGGYMEESLHGKKYIVLLVSCQDGIRECHATHVRVE